MVGAHFQVLLQGEEPPGEIARRQPGQGDGQGPQAAAPGLGAQPGQGQGRGQDQGGGQGRAFVLAPGHARQTAGREGEAAPGRGVGQP